MAISAADKARAAEALNRSPNLPPIARRLGIELLNRADKRTGTCWPSEARLALALGCDERSIRRAKVALQAAGFLTWSCRGQHRTPIYVLAWEALKALAATLKAKAKAAFTSTPKISSIVVKKTAEIVAPKHQPEGTFSSAYLTQLRKLIGGGRSTGSGLQPFKPRQLLSDQQLNAKASSRLWAALQRLTPQHLETLIGQVSESAQAEAIKAERFAPGTGLATLSRLLGREALA